MDLDIYEIDDVNEHRYLLGKRGFRQVLVLGVNPSTATDQTPDKTLSNVMKILDSHGYDGFCMANLYPQRATVFESLPEKPDLKQIDENIEKIKQQLEGTHTMAIWAAWGNTIAKREYLAYSLTQLVNRANLTEYVWLSYNEFTLEGHPRHPSRVALDGKLIEFDVSDYLQTLKTMPIEE